MANHKPHKEYQTPSLTVQSKGHTPFKHIEEQLKLNRICSPKPDHGLMISCIEIRLVTPSLWHAAGGAVLLRLALPHANESGHRDHWGGKCSWGCVRDVLTMETTPVCWWVFRGDVVVWLMVRATTCGYLRRLLKFWGGPNSVIIQQ